MLKKTKLFISLAAILCTYAVIVRYTTFRIPCFFHTITGYSCPGCGITRMFYYLSFGDLQHASQANLFLFWSIPLLSGFFLIYYFLFSKSKNKLRQKKFVNRSALYYLIALFIWFIVRNIISI